MIKKILILRRIWRDWLVLATVPDLGPTRFVKLIRHFGSPENVFKAHKDNMLMWMIGRSLAEKIKNKTDYKFAEEQEKLLLRGIMNSVI